MLSKKEHIAHWLQSADEDMVTADVLYKGKRAGFCLFSLHLAIEKTLKALWIKESINNTPPYTHDLVRLVEDCGLELDPAQVDFLTIINSWNIRGRYPDFTKALHNKATEKYVEEQFQKIINLKKWLEQKI